MSRDSINVLSLFSGETANRRQSTDAMKNKKIEKLKIIRRSEKYQRFIDKFRKYIIT